MVDTPEMAAYRNTRPDLHILMDGGVWNAPEPPGLVQSAPQHRTIDAMFRMFQYKARRIGPTRYEIYSVETGEVVGRIN
jgi:hypothetical protein